MAELRTLGYIEVVHGRTGGFRLSHAGRKATVGQVLRQLDTRTDAAECVAPGGNCPLINECRLPAALSRAREAFYRELDSVNIADLPVARQMAPVFSMIGLHPRL